MKKTDHQFFKLLKEHVARTFLSEHSASPKIENWKGEDIVIFQEDLFSKVKAKVSEKWFYTYFKNDTEKLPRIDMLNLLSSYVGYKNWNDFKFSNTSEIEKSKRKHNIKTLLLSLLLFAIAVIVFKAYNWKNTFHFCFTDSIRNLAITNTPLDIKVLQNSESPLLFKTDSLGCFSYTTKDPVITLVVQSPYHKTDTIVRHIDSNYNKTVALSANEYALMLHYYTNGNIKDWKKHRAQLDNLIDEDALIYQFFKNSIGVELYSKEEFIRTLTIPTSTLKNITILDKTFKDGKIMKLKFIVE